MSNYKDEKTGLSQEDYLEPACPLCENPTDTAKQIQAVPQQRILDKLDVYMSHRDYDGAERHLLYWMEEAKISHDQRGELLLCNELVGHYRKTGQREKAFQYADRAMELLEEMDFRDSISAGTTYVNIATACNAFGENERSLELFEKARKVYESSPHTPSHLLGGLYNNMALVCQSMGKYGDAYTLYDKAMDKMATVPGGVLEQAITCLNMADAVAAELGLEEGESRINMLVEQAYDLLKDESAPRNGYYAFVCEKCAPSFSYYGYFAAAEEFQEEARKIYERA